MLTPVQRRILKRFLNEATQQDLIEAQFQIRHRLWEMEPRRVKKTVDVSVQ